MDPSTGSPQSLKSGRRLFEVVERVARHQPIGVTELSRELDIPKSTAQVYLNTLGESRYVVKRDGKYRLGLRFFEHGMNALRNFRIYPTAKPKVYELARETGELAAAFVEEHGEAIYVLAAGGDNAIRTDLNIGSRTGLHCTAGGKAILAYLPQEYVEEVVAEHGLPGMTESTITDPDELHGELERIRERGVAFNEEESIPGMHAVAAPIRFRDTVLGAISISGPSSRLVGSVLEEELAGTVKGTANEIELNLEYDETVY